MDKLVVINSCMREDSRTKVILEAALEELASRYEIEIIDVNALALPPVTPEILKERTSGYVPQTTLSIAGKVASADRIVIAAPFWDMSFPSVLKAFLENLSLYNVTFTDDGTTCKGLCKCRKVLSQSPLKPLGPWRSNHCRRLESGLPLRRKRIRHSQPNSRIRKNHSPRFLTPFKDVYIFSGYQ